MVTHMRKLMRKLYEKSEAPPTRLQLDGIILQSSEPVDGGGFADVYQGTDDCGRLVALKRIRKHYGTEIALAKVGFIIL